MYSAGIFRFLVKGFSSDLSVPVTWWQLSQCRARRGCPVLAAGCLAASEPSVHGFGFHYAHDTDLKKKRLKRHLAHSHGMMEQVSPVFRAALWGSRGPLRAGICGTVIPGTVLYFTQPALWKAWEESRSSLLPLLCCDASFLPLTLPTVVLMV